MKTYAFKVIVEPDEDRWHAYCPALSDWAAATWGSTEEEAYQNIQEVVQMVIEGMIEENILIPTESAELLPEPRVTVAVPAITVRSVDSPPEKSSVPSNEMGSISGDKRAAISNITTQTAEK